jgi:acyl dehydratase
VFLSQNWKFTAPVFIGDTITAGAEVLSVHPSKPVTELKGSDRVRRRDDRPRGRGLVLHLPTGPDFQLIRRPRP